MCWALIFKGHTFFMHTKVIQSCRFTSVYITFYWTPGVKGCVHYLNKRSTSPTYILYQLNEQKISYHIFFSLTHCRFQKKASRQQSASFPLPTLCLWNLLRENRGKPIFSQLSNCITYCNAYTNSASTVTELLSIILRNKILKAIVYLIKKYLFSRISCKNIFYSFIRNFLNK